MKAPAKQDAGRHSGSKGCSLSLTRMMAVQLRLGPSHVSAVRRNNIKSDAVIAACLEVFLFLSSNN